MAGTPPAEATPLEDFHAERSLVPKKASTENPTCGKLSASVPNEREFELSLERLARCWLSYGGSQLMCPGRHFPKGEIIGTFALLFNKYDIESIDSRFGEREA